MRPPLMMAGVALAALLLGSAPHRAKADGSAARVDVPIRQTVLPNGDTRYSVPISVGGSGPIDAELDTGSFGLRVLARVLASNEYEATDMQRHYVFGGGARFNGILAKARIGVGDAKAETPILFQLIQSVDCAERKPHCPASRLDPKDYRIAGDGYAGQGFDAILGLSMRKAAANAGADNPLGSIGDAAWIVVLPRPGSAASGHLIINPSSDETSGFMSVKLEPQPGNGDGEPGLPGWKDAALSGCLVNEASKEKLCGPTLLDSGAPGFVAMSPHASGPTAWPEGTRANFQLSGGSEPVEIPFTVGRDVATKVHVVPPRPSGGGGVSAGSFPFFSYAVLYDLKRGVMGLKRRPDNEP